VSRPAAVRCAASAALGCAVLGALTADRTPAAAAEADAAVRGPAQIRLVGLAGDPGGVSVGDAGDVNGDGRRDLVVGTPGTDVPGRPDAGVAFVVYGSQGPRRVDVRQLGSASFRIDGPASLLPTTEFEEDGGPFGDSAGTDVSGVGDVNGDGLDDVAVSAPRSGAGLRQGAGSVYVVFGARSGEDIDLGALGPRGFRIDGDRVADELGGVTRAGDTDGDGLDDIALTSTRSGAYVVAGRRSTSTVDLRRLGSEGTRIRRTSATRPEYGSLSIAAAGDVDRDGLAEVVVGDSSASARGRRRAGSVWVVRGTQARTPVVLDSLGARGHRYDGPARNSTVGSSVAPAGDVDGDGRVDVVVGAVTEDDFELPEPGGSGPPSYVLYGGAAPGRATDLRRPGREALTIQGPAGAESFGAAVAGAGDVDADGRADLAIGSPLTDYGCRTDAGAVYVVRGAGRHRSTRLTESSRAWYRFLGARAGGNAGASLAPALRGVIVAAPGLGTRPYVDSIDAAFAHRSPARTRPRRCLSISSPVRRGSRLARVGSLPVTVRAREAGPVFDGVEIEATLLRGGGDLSLGNRTVGFSRPGTRRVRLPLSRRARAFLRAHPRGRIRLRAAQEALGNTRRAASAVRLR